MTSSLLRILAAGARANTAESPDTARSLRNGRVVVIAHSAFSLRIVTPLARTGWHPHDPTRTYSHVTRLSPAILLACGLGHGWRPTRRRHR
jgi:hypothetical protein